jgi:hypothetical protein
LEYEQDFASLVRLTQIGCKMFRWTEASISYSNLSVVVTCEHGDSASSPTRLQLMGGAESRENPTSIVQISPYPWHLRTLGLEPHHLEQHSQERLHRHHAPPNPATSSRCYHLAGVGICHLNTDGTLR